MPEYYFDNEFPTDSNLEKLLGSQPADDDAVDNDDEVFANAAAADDTGVDVDDADEDVEKAIDEKDFDT